MRKRAARRVGRTVGVAALLAAACGLDVVGVTPEDDAGAPEGGPRGPRPDSGQTTGRDADAPTDANTSDVALDASIDAPADALASMALYLFVGASKSGALGGRAGADALCAIAQASAPVTFSTTRALLSVAPDDEIRDMPALYGVPTNRRVLSFAQVMVALSWADLLDGGISQPLSSAGVHTGFWYSGSNPDGTIALADGGQVVATTTCAGWTLDTSMVPDGTYGESSSMGASWMSAGLAPCGDDSYRVLCVGWNP